MESIVVDRVTRETFWLRLFYALLILQILLVSTSLDTHDKSSKQFDTGWELGDFEYKLKVYSVTELDGHPFLLFMPDYMQWALIRCPAAPGKSRYHPCSHHGVIGHLANTYARQFKQYPDHGLRKLSEDSGKEVDMNAYHLHDKPMYTNGGVRRQPSPQ